MDELMEYLERFGLSLRVTEDPEILFEIFEWLNRPASANKEEDLQFLFRNGVKLEISSIDKMGETLGYSEIFENLPDLFKKNISISLNLSAPNERGFAIFFSTSLRIEELEKRVALDIEKNPAQYGMSKREQEMRWIFNKEEILRKKAKKELLGFYKILTKELHKNELDDFCDGLKRNLAEGGSKRTNFEKIVEKSNEGHFDTED